MDGKKKYDYYTLDGVRLLLHKRKGSTIMQNV